MYGRGARLLTQPALSTAPGVGPGTYRVENGGKRPGSMYKNAFATTVKLPACHCARGTQVRNGHDFYARSTR